MPLLSLALAAAMFQDTGEFVLLATNPAVAEMVSTSVAGPRNARTLTAVFYLGKATRGGWNNVVADLAVDCDAGTVQYVLSRAYVDDKLASTRPVQPAAVPVADGLDAVVLTYACTGRTASRDQTHVTGIAAARAYARQVAPR
jgi:hypothetical protein